MSIMVLVQQILVILLIIATGIVASKLNILTDSTTKSLSELLLKITLPATLLAATSYGGGRQAVNEMLLYCLIILIFFAVCTVICEVLAKSFKLPREKRSIFVMFSVLPNSLFIGMPLITALFPENSMTYLVAGILSFNLYFFTYGTALFTKQSKFSIKVLITPGNIATFILIFMLVFNLRFPVMLETAFSLIGDITSPLALLLIGVMLSNGNIIAMLKNKFLYVITFLRCLVFPIALALCLKFTPIDKDAALAIVLLMACAAGALGASLARKEGVQPELASLAVVHTTVFIIASLPLVSIIAQNILLGA